ncbi:MAG: response regulator transcription factor [Halieaceae bacterium]|jgi:DNA-binding NarL/FixJ family response regulator|nr:response regulator transcription factor [Halieaceae bacterium]
MSSPGVTQKTVLIADDHPIFRQGLKQIVEKLPDMKIVSEAETGEATIAQTRYHKPDLILLDIAMPGMDGLQVLESLAGLDDMPAVIIVTSYDDRAYLDRAMELGARAYVLKDSAGDDLVNCLQAVNRGEIYITPSLGSHTPQIPKVPSIGTTGLDTLTRMEHIILTRVAQFKTSKEIAVELGISYRTVQNHRANICGKLGLHGAHQLMAFAREHSSLLST